MRGERSARHTALKLALAALASCAYGVPRQAGPREPPPHVLVVGFEQVALRTSAWVELHTWLAAAARAAEPIGDPELDVAAKRYAGPLAEDDGDQLLARTTHALAACEDARCARAAIAGTPFAEAYGAALPTFLSRHWTDRAATARGGIEVARAAVGPEVEPLVAKLAHDLAIEWPLSPPVVDLVGDAPEAGREAPIRVVLGARTSCFKAQPNETERVHDARIVDCLLAYAAAGLRSKSALAAALVGERGNHAWIALVVHAVAVVVTGWEPKHASVLRRSALAVMPKAMTWLAAEWPSRMRGEPPADFARRYVAALEEP